MALDQFALQIGALAAGRPVDPDDRRKILWAAAAVTAGAHPPSFVFISRGEGLFLAGDEAHPRRILEHGRRVNITALHAVVAAKGALVPLDRSRGAKRLQLQGAAHRIGGDLGRLLRCGLHVGQAGARFAPEGAAVIRMT